MEFDALYEAYRDKVFRIYLGYVNDHDWAADIAQDTFITIWQQLPRFRHESAPGTWIYRITVNNCLRQIKRENRMLRTEMPEQIAEHPEPGTEPKVRRLYQCIAALPETDRLIISLELEGIRQAEIARIVGLGESNVRVKLYRIRKNLAKKLKNDEDGR